MLMFLASVLEQLDLALEHISKREVHNARFGLLLTDNAVELMLHQMAKDKAGHFELFHFLRDEYPHKAALDKALKRSFDAKVKFAKLEGNLSDEVAQTINIMHEFRNELYHVGLQHEAILPGLARFYFDAVCRYLGRYEPDGLGWTYKDEMPERAKKYFHDRGGFPGQPEDFGNGCLALAKQCGHDPAQTVAALADHMDDIIAEQDSDIAIMAGGVYEGEQITRDKAVTECQAWTVAFSEEGRAFAMERGWTGNMLEFVDFLSDHYPLKFRGDPVPSWRHQVAKLRAQKNPHAALAHYHSFMAQTADIREALSEAAGRVEEQIDMEIDRARGKFDFDLE
jgi:hypothetical protein